MPTAVDFFFSRQVCNALQNEPHTRDLYEKNRGMPAGQLVKNWLGEMSAWLKGLDSNHLISSGEEGYRAGGPTETQGNVGANNWINGGYKGWMPISL